MDPAELLRLIDSLRREKDIDVETVFQGIEAALLSAARKQFATSTDLSITIDRETGRIIAKDGDRDIDPTELGRIPAQTAKQVMIQKIREAERDAISNDFTARLMEVATGTVQRFEGPNIIVNLGRTEGFLPRSEQIVNELYHVGERIRALVLEVKTVGTKVRILLSRSHPEFVRRLFDLEVPEVGEGIIQVMAIARESGHRTKIAVASLDPRVDCVGACVGVQGTRIRSIVDELNGEKIDIVRWHDALDVLITNTLKPAEVSSILLDEANKRAVVIVPEDQLSLAIGKRGQNVRLAAKLTGWDIDLKTRAELEGQAAAESQAAEAASGEEAEQEQETPTSEVPGPEPAEQVGEETPVPEVAAPTEDLQDEAPASEVAQPTDQPHIETPADDGPARTAPAAEAPIPDTAKTDDKEA